jgi:hypothetical protein
MNIVDNARNKSELAEMDAMKTIAYNSAVTSNDLVRADYIMNKQSEGIDLDRLQNIYKNRQLYGIADQRKELAQLTKLVHNIDPDVSAFHIEELYQREKSTMGNINRLLEELPGIDRDDLHEYYIDDTLVFPDEIQYNQPLKDEELEQKYQEVSPEPTEPIQMAPLTPVVTNTPQTRTPQTRTTKLEKKRDRYNSEIAVMEDLYKKLVKEYNNVLEKKSTRATERQLIKIRSKMDKMQNELEASIDSRNKLLTPIRESQQLQLDPQTSTPQTSITGQGVAKSNSKSPKIAFGKYLIDRKKLKKGILSMTDARGMKIADFPNMQISPTMMKFLTLKQLNTNKYKFSGPEKQFLTKLIQKSNVEVTGSKTKLLQSDGVNYADLLKKDLELIIGEIDSGNDNEELIEKLSETLRQLVLMGHLTRRDAKKIIKEYIGDV